MRFFLALAVVVDGVVVIEDVVVVEDVVAVAVAVEAFVISSFFSCPFL